MKDKIYNNEIYLKTREIVNKYNLMGLIKNDSKSNEYEVEIKDIIIQCFYTKDINKFNSEINKIFDFWFKGIDCNNTDSGDMCKELFELYSKYNNDNFNNNKENPICIMCDNFKVYCKTDGNNEQNCVKWLCNNGTCKYNIPIIVNNKKLLELINNEKVIDKE